MQQVAAIPPTEATQPKTPTPDAASKTGNTFIVYTGDKSPTEFLNDFIKEKQSVDSTGLIKSSQIDPVKLLTDAFKVNYFDN